jgi:hypothetical protein
MRICGEGLSILRLSSNMDDADVFSLWMSGQLICLYNALVVTLDGIYESQ